MTIKHIELNIGKACNNRCIFCMSKNVPPEMLKLSEIVFLKGRIKHYFDEGYNSIGFLGGDISIHPKIIEIIKYSKDLGFKHINIITNAMLFDDYDFARRIVEAGTTRVNISIHSHLHNIEDHLTRVKGGLQRKFDAIDNFNDLHSKGILKSHLSINIVINKINYETVVETVLYYYKVKNIKDIRLNFVWLSKGVKDSWDLIRLSYTEFLPYLKKLIYISLKYNIRITFDTIPPCIFYKIDPVNYDKLIKKFLGEQFDVIDQIEHTNVHNEKNKLMWKEEKFKWKEKKRNVLKKKSRNCDNCRYTSICEGVWKEYDKLYGFGEFEAIK